MSRYNVAVVHWSDRSRPGALPENALEEARRARQQRGEGLIDLTLSNPTAAGLSYPRDLLSFEDGVALYQPDALGMRSAREAIASRMRGFGVPAAAERMLLTASTSEAYGLLFKLLCDPGAEVLVPTPSYPLFEHLARLESVVPVSYPLLFADEFRIDFDALRKRITPRTRAIVVVSPNNPTGSVLQADELAQLATLGLPLICDEVFGEYRTGVGSPGPRTALHTALHTALDASSALSFCLFGLSKLVGLPQLKLAWTCVSGPDAQVTEAMTRLELIADTYLSVNTPVQLNVARVLDVGADVRAQIQQRIMDNLALVTQVVGEQPAVTLLAPAGGWTAVLRVPMVQSEERWVLGLMDEGVLVHPGYYYDFASEAYLVISLLPTPEVIREGLARLCAYVARQLE